MHMKNAYAITFCSPGQKLNELQSQDRSLDESVGKGADFLFPLERILPPISSGNEAVSTLLWPERIPGVPEGSGGQERKHIMNAPLECT